MSDKASAVLGFLKDTVSDVVYSSIENEVARRINDEIAFAVDWEHKDCAYNAAQAMHAAGVKDDKLFPLVQKYFALNDDLLYDLQHHIMTVDRPLEALKQYMCDTGRSASGAEKYIRDNHLKSVLCNEPQLAKMKPDALLSEIDRRAAERTK